jgi:hypothetical protein
MQELVRAVVAALAHAPQSSLGVLGAPNALDGSEIAAIARLASGCHPSTLRPAGPGTRSRWAVVRQVLGAKRVGSPSEPSSGRGEAARDRTGRESPRRKSPGTPLARSPTATGRRMQGSARARPPGNLDRQVASPAESNEAASLVLPASGVQGRCFCVPDDHGTDVPTWPAANCHVSARTPAIGLSEDLHEIAFKVGFGSADRARSWESRSTRLEER